MSGLGEPTVDELREAFARLSAAGNADGTWPTFELALEHAVLSKVLRAMANQAKQDADLRSRSVVTIRAQIANGEWRTRRVLGEVTPQLALSKDLT